MFQKILFNLAVKLATEEVIGRMAVHLLRLGAKQTTNGVDDAMVETVAKAFGVEDEDQVK